MWNKKYNIVIYCLLPLYLARWKPFAPCDISFESKTESAMILFQKRLYQFLRQQQLHAQQAAHYIWEKIDSISSHSTVPMLCSLLMLFVKKICSVLTNSEDNEIGGPNNNDPVKPVSLKLTADEWGQILKHR